MPLLNNEGITRQELSSDLNEELNEIGILSQDVNKNTSDIADLQQAHTTHLAEDMPHLFNDATTQKNYKYGFKQQNNHLVFIFEEVV